MFEVRDERFKLVARPSQQSFELFDLETDPGERVDVAAENPAELEALRSAFRAWRAGPETAADVLDSARRRDRGGSAFAGLYPVGDFPRRGGFRADLRV